MVNRHEARALAERHLAEALPQRWHHVQAVAGRADHVAATLGMTDEVLVAAAWLHDIGYAPVLRETGFHALDGGRYLRQIGVDERIVCLVAHHSCAVIEADERGLLDELGREFAHEASPTSDALWYCDMTIGPDGQEFAASSRLEEARSRYGQGHIVTRSIDRAESDILAAVRRTEGRLRMAGRVAAEPDQPMYGSERPSK